MQEKISIILPICNVEKYLSFCLDSILAQTYKNIEILCIINLDSRRPDTSENIVLEYMKKDTRISIFREGIVGPGGARNRGIQESSGEFIVFIDSDDIISEKYVELLYNGIKQEDGIDIALTENIVLFKAIDNQKILLDKHRVELLPNNISKENQIYTSMTEKVENILNIWEFSTCNKIFRKSFLLQNHLFFQKNRHIEDAPFMILALLFSKKLNILSLTKDLFYFYRKQHQSIMSSKKIPFMHVYINYQNYLIDPKIKKQFKQYSLPDQQLAYLLLFKIFFQISNLYFSYWRNRCQFFKLLRACKVEKKIFQEIVTYVPETRKINGYMTYISRKNPLKNIYVLKKIRMVHKYKIGAKNYSQGWVYLFESKELIKLSHMSFIDLRKRKV